MQRKILTVIIPLVIVALAASLAVYDRDMERKNAAAIVNGVPIDKAEFETTLEQAKESYKQMGVDLESEEAKELLAEVEKDTLDNMINRELLLQDVEKKGYKATSEQIKERLEMIKSQFPDEETFNEVLKTNNLTLEKLNQIIADDLKIEQYIEKEIPTPEVTEEEMKALYDQYSAQMGEELPDFDLLKPQIEMQLQQEKQQQALDKILEELEKNSEIEIIG